MSQPVPSDLRHGTVPAPAGRLHFVEQGAGPLVLLVHGFPESWYAWRHQLPALAAAGYRAVAPDVRGYGRSSKPAAVHDYRMRALAADNVALVHALGERTAVIVGHDWGSGIAAVSALLHPEVFRAVGLLSVPYAPPGGPRPSEAFARIGGDQEFYVSYFQQPGRAEAEIEPDVRGWLAGIYAALSADTMPQRDAPDPHFVAPGGTLRERFPEGRRPAWLSEADLDHYAGEFERTGMTGALNRYRAMDHDWEDLAEFDGAPLTQPSLFVGGALDASTTWMAEAIDAFPTTLPGLVDSRILDGCGHWLQQERPQETNELLLSWLAAVSAPARLGRVQREHWEQTYTAHPGMYGEAPSDAARYAAEAFHAAGAVDVVELGAGQGRDALYFAREGFTVRATDFSAAGLDQLRTAAGTQAVAGRVSTAVHDVREPLPFEDGSADAVFAHMLLCMALSAEEIRALVGEVRRVLRPGGVLVYTVRHTGDAHYGDGLGHGDDIWEHGGFAVHFFPRALVDSLAEGWTLKDVHPFEEGGLPRRLWRVTQTLPR